MITSRSNPKVQTVRSLLSRRSERQKAGAFVVEGVRLTEEALASGWETQQVLYSADLSERGQALLEGFGRQGAEVEEVSPDVLKSLADTETPQGILAVVRRQTPVLPAEPDYLLVIDQLRDPGNLGTILRTAASAGVQGVLLTPGTTDAFAPKVVRAGMGAHFHLPIVEMSPAEIIAYCKRDRRPGLGLYLAESGGGRACWEADFRRPLALVIGGEAEGAGEELRRAVDEPVTIPMPGQAESLNAAIAAAILIYEVVRQRSTSHR